MAVKLDPNETCKFWLAADKDKKPEDRRIFTCIAGNRRIRKQHEALLEKAVNFRIDQFRLIDQRKFEEAKVAHQSRLKTLEEAIFLGVTGWNIADVPFEKSIDAMDEILRDDDELIELARDWPLAGKLTEDDLKNSPSPQDTGAEKSAPDAVAENSVKPSTTPTNP
ncbi:MAG: hypothetical protein QM754_18560 [Tepidisphaeraceae bacterium]